MSAGTDTSDDRALQQWRDRRNAETLRQLQRLERQRQHERANECARLWAERSANATQERQP